MDKKERFLASVTHRRSQTLLEKFNSYTKEFCSLRHDLLARLKDLSSEEQSISQDNNSFFICDQSFQELLSTQSQYALAISEFTSRHLLNKSASPGVQSNESVNITCSPHCNPEDSSTLRSVELARLASCKRMTALLDLEFVTKEAVLESEVAILSRWLETQEVSEDSSDCNKENYQLQTDEERIADLRNKYAELARELAYLDVLELKQVQLDRNRTHQKHYVDCVHKILDAVAFENAWLRLSTDLLQMESETCRKVSNQLRTIKETLDSLLSDGEKYLSFMSSLPLSASQVENEKLAQLSVTQRFEHTVREILCSCSSPNIAHKATESSDSEQLLLLLAELKDNSEKDAASAHPTANNMLKHANRLNAQLRSLTKPLSLPSKSGTESGHSRPHSDRVSGDRLRETFNGLCDTDVIELFVNACSDLDHLATELATLRDQSNLAFSL